MVSSEKKKNQPKDTMLLGRQLAATDICRIRLSCLIAKICLLPLYCNLLSTLAR